MSGRKFEDIASFHHLGIAVRDFGTAKAFYTTLGYTCSAPVVDKLQNVELMMCESPVFPDLELIRPLDETSPVNNFLEKSSEKIYHLGFTVKDIPEVVAVLEKNHSIYCISEAKPATLFADKEVSFYYVPNVGLFEFIEK